MSIDVRLECKPLQMQEDIDLEKLVRDESGMCLPLGTLNSDEIFASIIYNYLDLNRPYLTDVRFVNHMGGEPKYVKISPNLEIQHEETWDKIYDMWPVIIERLCGNDNVCFLSNWNLLEKDLHELLPREYGGEIIKRGKIPEIPVLLEWRRELVNNNRVGTVFSRSAFRDIWSYGMWGYVLPKRFVADLRRWTIMTVLTQNLVEEFFREILLVFTVKYELEGIWIMSHKMNWQEVCRLIRVEEINKELLNV